MCNKIRQKIKHIKYRIVHSSRVATLTELSLRKYIYSIGLNDYEYRKLLRNGKLEEADIKYYQRVSKHTKSEVSLTGKRPIYIDGHDTGYTMDGNGYLYDRLGHPRQNEHAIETIIVRLQGEKIPLDRLDTFKRIWGESGLVDFRFGRDYEYNKIYKYHIVNLVTGKDFRFSSISSFANKYKLNRHKLFRLVYCEINEYCDFIVGNNNIKTKTQGDK